MASKLILAAVACAGVMAAGYAFSSDGDDRPVDPPAHVSSATDAAMRRLDSETPDPPVESRKSTVCLSGPLGFGRCPSR